MQVLFHREQTILGKITSSIFETDARATRASRLGCIIVGVGDSERAPTKHRHCPVLDKAAAAKKEKLEWRTSMIDLMKALDIDRSLAARKELAKTGDANDPASMNVWLHKQVMGKLAARGGKLPPEIKH